MGNNVVIYRKIFLILFNIGLTITATVCSAGSNAVVQQEFERQSTSIQQIRPPQIDIASVIETVRHHIKESDNQKDLLEVESRLYKAEFAKEGFSLTLRKKLSEQELSAKKAAWRKSRPADSTNEQDTSLLNNNQAEQTLPAEAIPFEKRPIYIVATEEIHIGEKKAPVSQKAWKSKYNYATREITPGVFERVTAREGQVEWDFILQRF